MLRRRNVMRFFCLVILLVLCLYPGSPSVSAAAKTGQVTGTVRDSAAVAAVADGYRTGLSPAVRARAALKNRIFNKYREMAVISDAQYRITQTAIFLQIPPHGEHPCLRLTLPTAERAVVFHHIMLNMPDAHIKRSCHDCGSSVLYS